MVTKASRLLAVLLLGCGPSAADYPFVRGEGCEAGCDDAGVDASAPDAGPPTIPDEPLEDWDTSGAGPLSGVFAVEVIMPARAVVEVETRQLYRMRILQRDETLRMLITPCRFALPSVPSVATLSIPPRLEAVLRTTAIEAEGPFLSAADPLGATITTPRSVVLLGAELADPEADPLPTVDTPGAAIDQDDDGQPGVTIAADTVLCREPGELYLALRATVEMSATIDDLDRIEGAVTPTLDQSVLGVSHRCLNAAASLEVELLDGSSFTALRTDETLDHDGNGNVSCPEITLRAASLFGDFWEP